MIFVESEMYLTPPFYHKNPANNSNIYGPIYFCPLPTLVCQEFFFFYVPNSNLYVL